MRRPPAPRACASSPPAWGYHGEGGDPNAWDADAVVAHPREILDLL